MKYNKMPFMSLNPMCSLSHRNIYKSFTIPKLERTKMKKHISLF